MRPYTLVWMRHFYNSTPRWEPILDDLGFEIVAEGPADARRRLSELSSGVYEFYHNEHSRPSFGYKLPCGRVRELKGL